jgi:transcriptional regulator GlxA family with amidase domain
MSMKVLFALFKDITFLDFFGCYEVLYKVNTMNIDKDLIIDFSFQSEEIKDRNQFTIKATKILPDLKPYDVLIVPGGKGTRELVNNKEYINYLKGWDKDKLLIGICTGALLIGKAGFLKDKVATTHYKNFDLLAEYCDNIVHKKLVQDDLVITTGAVTSSIDAGLYFVERYYGFENCKKIMDQIDYPVYVENKKNMLIKDK